jgi:hypothetical protein
LSCSIFRATTGGRHGIWISISSDRKGAETANAIKNKFGGGSVVYAVFDISLLRDGEKIQPNGNVGVRILIDAAGYRRLGQRANKASYLVRYWIVDEAHKDIVLENH